MLIFSWEGEDNNNISRGFRKGNKRGVSLTHCRTTRRGMELEKGNGVGEEGQNSRTGRPMIACPCKALLALSASLKSYYNEKTIKKKD